VADGCYTHTLSGREWILCVAAKECCYNTVL